MDVDGGPEPTPPTSGDESSSSVQQTSLNAIIAQHFQDGAVADGCIEAMDVQKRSVRLCVSEQKLPHRFENSRRLSVVISKMV